MCGRYTLLTPEIVIEIKNIVKEAEERLRQRQTANVRAKQIVTDNIRPTDLAPVLFPYKGRLTGEGFACAAAFWGFTNCHEWENRKREADGLKPLKPSPCFNARDDKLEASPFWRESFHKRRCIIPAASFEEWWHAQPKEPGKRPKDKGVPYEFTMPGSPILYIAGIWQNEVDETGEKWPHYAMITTEPSASVQAVHNRMPLVISPDEFAVWLGDGYKALLARKQLELCRRAIA